MNPVPDLPYQSQAQTPLDLSDAVFCSGLVVMAAKIDVDLDAVPGDAVPALVFRFADADGQFIRPLVLPSDPKRLQDLVDLVTKAAADAARVADT